MMELPFASFSESLGAKIAIAVLTVTTAATSGVAGYKIVKTVSQEPPEVASAVEIHEESVAGTSREGVSSWPTGPSANILPTATKGPSSALSNIPFPTVLPKSAATGATGAIVNANRCVITISGSQYDVTPLKSTHPGGDVFSCGTDMTTAYTRQHGSNFSQLSKYLVTSNGQSNTPLPPSGASGGNGSSYEDDDDDEKEYEDEQESHKEDESEDDDHKSEEEHE